MKRILFLTILLGGLYIKAQTIPLSQYFDNKSSGVYMKDIENVLPLFEGKWTANFNDNKITLVLKKFKKFPVKASRFSDLSYDRDVLLMTYTIKDPKGKLLYSTVDRKIASPYSIISSAAVLSPEKRVLFQYDGEECPNTNGGIFLTYIDSTHIQWELKLICRLGNTTVCKKTDNAKLFPPRAPELIFTKQ
ncbi:TPA: hypothetical protein I9Y78_001521 [Elizabethkingia anophelis]|uniref:DUF6705 family protein n=1 Tax=Elizabethkingia anophelis TaxID=1117645 RepID=UPI00040E4397|nr:hypothetical protein [Elizabethkingia anophelis]MCT3743449.1 hypothetical protein [Elizabethkingia anophelis]MDC8024927.1 hypothetical protein [Elizabethkingia anophelis]MDV3490446.1 hypothetical protein [Elizabethkingia anophelis]MDV4128542.1 hypothetical protein [Elizabethkingia anophelis]MDV4134602.1 hypothetical protein [Elizabethkingia anophelis]